MTTWLIVPDNKLDDLEALNAMQTNKQCTVINTIEGVHITGADKIGDEYWANYQNFLLGLEAFDGTIAFN